MRKLTSSFLAVGIGLALAGCGLIGLEPTPTPTETVPAMAVGDTIEFGSWYTIPIEWRVLAIEKDRFLVITKQPVAIRQYHQENTDVTWEDSAVRQWLAHQFLQLAFSYTEQETILTTKLTNPDDAVYGTPGGADTEDKVFLLSSDEAGQYFADDADRTTDYTTTQTDVTYLLQIAKDSWGYDEKKLADLAEFLRTVTLDKTDQVSWWLRSPERAPDFASAVLRDGSLGGWEVFLDGAVRPAMWIQTPAATEDDTDQPG